MGGNPRYIYESRDRRADPPTWAMLFERLTSSPGYGDSSRGGGTRTTRPDSVRSQATPSQDSRRVLPVRAAIGCIQGWLSRGKSAAV